MQSEIEELFDRCNQRGVVIDRMVNLPLADIRRHEDGRHAYTQAVEGKGRGHGNFSVRVDGLGWGHVVVEAAVLII